MYGQTKGVIDKKQKYINNRIKITAIELSHFHYLVS